MEAVDDELIKNAMASYFIVCYVGGFFFMREKDSQTSTVKRIIPTEADSNRLRYHGEMSCLDKL